MAHFILKKSLHLIFDGRVQGVGFRFTAQHFAHELGVTGWVRNLPDEVSVEMLAQGDAASVDGFIQRLKDQFSVSGVRVSEGSMTPEFTSFEIRY
ncbi:MAG: acylphosphatase [Candidatus Omnitrophica bacterium]|nr:acylphosphatase [Candidatus Omnitrophota bacterium]